MEQSQDYRLSDIMAAYGRRQELPPFDLALDWFCQTCRALGDLHDRGVIHRAVSPEAIFIAKDDQVLIASLEPAAGPVGDFGARAGSGHSDYAAPEQRAGDFVDLRADLYAMGVVFYELLTLTRPSAAHRPASAINASVPAAFDRVLGRLMAASPANRFSDADEVLRAVEALTAARGAAARSLGDAASGPAGAEVAVPRAALIAAGVLIGAAAGAAAGYYLQLVIPLAAAVGSVVGGVVGVFTHPNA